MLCWFAAITGMQFANCSRNRASASSIKSSFFPIMLFSTLRLSCARVKNRIPAASKPVFSSLLCDLGLRNPRSKDRATLSCAERGPVISTLCTGSRERRFPPQWAAVAQSGSRELFWTTCNFEKFLAVTSRGTDHVRCRRDIRNIVPRAFTPVLAKHTKHLSLVDVLSIGIDRIQRNFEPMKKQVEAWKGTRIPDESAKLVIYGAFVQGELDVPKHLTQRVHDLYFNPQIEEFAPRTTWSLSNAFTNAFKDLDPIPQFRATAKLASFLDVATASRN